MKTYDYIKKILIATIDATVSTIIETGMHIKLQNKSGNLYFATPESLQQSLTTALEGNNNDLVYTVTEHGKKMYIEYIDPGVPNADASYTIVGDTLTVNLATGDGDAATTTIGSGTDGVVTITADTAGVAGNDLSITVDADLAQIRNLSSTITEGNIETLLAVVGDAAATASFGAPENGVVTVTAATVGTVANDYTINVQIAGEASASLTASFANDVLSVTLGTTVDGDADPAKNTTTLIAEAIDAITEFTAVASENGTITEATSAQFEGGTNKLNTSANTATLVASSIADLNGVTASASGGGTTAISGAVVKKNLTGGGENAAITTTSDAIKTLIDSVTSITAVDAAANDGSGVVTALAKTETLATLKATNGFTLLSTQEPIDIYVPDKLLLLSDGTTSACQMIVYEKLNY